MQKILSVTSQWFVLDNIHMHTHYTRQIVDNNSKIYLLNRHNYRICLLAQPSDSICNSIYNISRYNISSHFCY